MSNLNRTLKFVQHVEEEFYAAYFCFITAAETGKLSHYQLAGRALASDYFFLNDFIMGFYKIFLKFSHNFLSKYD